MPSRSPSIRSLARAIGLSRTTVSDALNGRGRVNPKTAARVARAAAQSGYIYNPLTGAVMSAMRRAQVRSFHGLIAVVDVQEPDRPPHGPFHAELLAGLCARAGELGFGVETFETGPRALSQRRLNTILASRGVRGVVVLPSWIPPDVSGLAWDRFAGIYTDYLIERPRLHSVCADHYRLMITAMSELKARGYRRPGYIVAQGRDDRIEHRQSAAFRAFQACHFSGPAVPPLITPEHPRFEADFRPWFSRYKPDVVLSHAQEAHDWMTACGARIPKTHGFVMLNVIDCRRPCAALDLQGRLIGARAVEMLVGQIVRNERGVPESSSRIAIQPRWIDGPTVRARERLNGSRGARAGRRAPRETQAKS